MRRSGRQEDAAPPWAPSEATAFRRFVGAPQGAAPGAVSGGGVAARVSKLHGVKRKPNVFAGASTSLLVGHTKEGISVHKLWRDWWSDRGGYKETNEDTTWKRKL